MDREEQEKIALSIVKHLKEISFAVDLTAHNKMYFKALADWHIAEIEKIQKRPVPIDREYFEQEIKKEKDRWHQAGWDDAMRTKNNKK